MRKLTFGRRLAGYMSLHLSNGTGIAFRAAIATGSLVAFLFALVLSSTPQLHDQLHGATGAASHECAATLLASGNYQYTRLAAVALAPPSPRRIFVPTLSSSPLVSPHLKFSVLEHAPPAVS
ncbi:MAG: hypothetical protein ACJ8M4_00935 [Chthoniobacterales bacterium]